MEDQIQSTVETNFKNHIQKALGHFFYNIFLYWLILPFKIWKSATIRLSEQSKKGGLKYSSFKGKWPFLSFLKTFYFDFLIDGSIFISYFVGPLYAIYMFIDLVGNDFGGALISFIMTLIVFYFSPIVFQIYRDIFQLLLLPIKKFIDWARKPAQHLEIDHKGELRRQ